MPSEDVIAPLPFGDKDDNIWAPLFQNETAGVRKPFSLCCVGALRSLNLSWSLSIFPYLSTFLSTFLHTCMILMIPEATTVWCPFPMRLHFLLDLPIERVLRTEVLLKFSAQFPPWFLVTLYFAPRDPRDPRYQRDPPRISIIALTDTPCWIPKGCWTAAALVTWPCR